MTRQEKPRCPASSSNRSSDPSRQFPPASSNDTRGFYVNRCVLRYMSEAYKMLIDASRKQRQAPDFLDGQPVEFQWPPRPRERHIFDWRFHG